MGIDHSNPYIHSITVLCDMYMYCIERSVNISITRITRVNNKYFCYVGIINYYYLFSKVRLGLRMFTEEGLHAIECAYARGQLIPFFLSS